MRPAGSRLALLLPALICLCAPAEAQTVFDVGPAGSRPHRRAAEAGPGFRYANSHGLLYSFNAFPGACSLVFSYPAADVNLRPMVSVFDRWPYDPMAVRYDLPMGPAVATGGKRIEYRWSMDISPASTGTLLYVVVEIPAGGSGSGSFPHEIYMAGPSPSPMPRMEKGVTRLAGPSGLLLAGGRDSVSYAADGAERKFDPDGLPVMPLPGDLVRNGSFRSGLNHWTPHRDRVAAEDARSFSLEDGILKIRASRESAREGVMQRIDADVKGAASVTLMADVRVVEQAQGGLGPEGGDAPIAIAVAYKDASGKENSDGVVFWKGFYALESEDPGRDSGGRKVLRDRWHRSIIDLMQLDPKPATILFISLEGSGRPVREGWIRDVHLIKSGGDK